MALQYRGTAGQMPELVKNGYFRQLETFWTLAPVWDFESTVNGDANGITAATGGVGTFAQTLIGITVDTITYDIKFTVTGMTAGSVTAKFGETSVEIAIVNGEYIASDVFTTTASLSFTPTTDFDGSVSQVSVKQQR